MVSNSDLHRWQQAINGVKAEQNGLSPDELTAFQTLISLINSRNFEASESGSYIQVIRNALKQHEKNSLLRAYLTNFGILCEKYFKEKKLKPEKPKQKYTKLILIGAAFVLLLIGCWQLYDNWETVSNWKPIHKLLENTIESEILVDSEIEIDEDNSIEESTVLPFSIVLDKSALIFGRAGEKKQLTATVFPAEVADENKKIVWKSDNEAVAKVDTNGWVTAVANGHAFISASTNNGLSDACSVEVKIIKVSDSNTPTIAQLNDLLNKIANADDQATDRLRSVLGNSLRVEGATNISNVQQLITDVSNGSHYKVTKVNTNDEGKLVSISVSKQ
jgi:hypothetical protein